MNLPYTPLTDPAPYEGYRHNINPDLGELIVRDMGDQEGQPIFNVTFFGNLNGFYQAQLLYNQGNKDAEYQFLEARQGKYNADGISSKEVDFFPTPLAMSINRIHTMTSDLLKTRSARREILSKMYQSTTTPYHYQPIDAHPSDPKQKNNTTA